jgi:putative flippase GtrA
MFGVNEYEFLLSVCGNANYIEFQVSLVISLFVSLIFHFISNSNISFPCASQMPRVDSFSFTPRMVNT